MNLSKRGFSAKSRAQPAVCSLARIAASATPAADRIRGSRRRRRRPWLLEEWRPGAVAGGAGRGAAKTAWASGTARCAFRRHDAVAEDQEGGC